MDSIDKRLVEDAAEIAAVVPDHAVRRIRHALEREATGAAPVRPQIRLPRPLMAGLAMGLVAVVASVLWFGQAKPPPVTVEKTAKPPALAGYQDTVTRLTTAIDLPMAGEHELEQELTLLNADLRRIQAGVRSQLDPLL